MPYQIIQNVTLATGVNSICDLVGYPPTPDPAGSVDPAIGQMRAALNQAASELYAMRDWQELVQEMNINVLADFQGQTEKPFALPPDYGRFVNQTQWSTSQQWPAIGPVSPQGWMSYLVRDWRPVVSLFWQIRNDKIWFMQPTFPVGAPFRAFYISKGWITDQDDPLLLKNVATKNGDTYLLDGLLVTLFGRLKWLEYKGFDTSSAARDFQTQYDSRAGSDKGASILSLSRMIGLPLITVGNVPDTGYGS